MEQEKAMDKEGRISSQIEPTEVIECKLFDQDQQQVEIQEDVLSWKLKTVILFTMLTMPGMLSDCWYQG